MIFEQTLTTIRKYLYPLSEINEIKFVYCNDKINNNHNVIECTCVYDEGPETVLEYTNLKKIIQILEELRIILNSVNLNFSYTITTLQELKDSVKNEQDNEEYMITNSLNNCAVIYCQSEEYINTFSKLRTRGKRT